MSSDNGEILIRALRASGSEREAQLAEAILGSPPSEAPVDVPEPVEPAGLTIGDVKEMSEAEINQNWAEVSKVMSASRSA